MYVVLVHYKKGIEEVDRHLVAHRDFLEKWYQAGALIASGPRNPRNGGIILAREMERPALEKILKADPFAQQGIAEYEILEFSPVKHAKEFAEFVSPWKG
ncbi:YciI family protein [bacterium]|nr:YciI family protein [bacterium]